MFDKIKEKFKSDRKKSQEYFDKMMKEIKEMKPEDYNSFSEYIRESQLRHQVAIDFALIKKLI